jgi:hypothetical protein
MTGRLLVAYDNSTNFVSTIAEYLDSFGRFSDWDVRYVHATHGAEIGFDLNEFDAIFQSYCASYCDRVGSDWHISPDYKAKLRAFRGVKVLAVQDEYQYTQRIHQSIREFSFHIVITSVPREMVDRIYPRTMFPNTEFLTVLTGYVPDSLAERGKKTPPLRNRPVTVGYRGRDIGALFGRLAYDKLEIGRRMREICVERDIAHDIEWSEDKRLYGDAWYDFIGSCRAQLGSESGSNVFDFDGGIAAKYQELSVARGGPVPYEEFRIYTDPVERQYDMGQISPRVFEAAAMRTPMILFTGRYSGLIEPEEHYIELQKDFSNVDAVLARIDDLDRLEDLAERAYNRLVGSGDFSYRRLVQLIDQSIFRKAVELGLKLRLPWAPADGTESCGEAATLFTLREYPAKTPRHSVFFRYKLMARHQAETARQQAEIARQQGEIAQQQDEIARQQDEIARQQAETARLRIAIASLGEEINHLRAVIGEYRARLRWLIKAYKLYKAGLAAMRKTVTDDRRVEH